MEVKERKGYISFSNFSKRTVCYKGNTKGLTVCQFVTFGYRMNNTPNITSTEKDFTYDAHLFPQWNMTKKMGLATK